MASSIDKLSSKLKIDEIVNLKKYYSGNQLSLLLRKVCIHMIMLTAWKN